MRAAPQLLTIFVLLTYSSESITAEPIMVQLPPSDRNVEFVGNKVNVHYDFDFSALSAMAPRDTVQCEIPGFTTVFSEGNALFPRRTDTFTLNNEPIDFSSARTKYREIEINASLPDSISIPLTAFAKDCCILLPAQTSGDNSVIRVEINPIVYDPMSHKARLYSSIDYSITLNESTSESYAAQSGIANAASPSSLGFQPEPTPDPIEYDPVIDRPYAQFREGYLILSVPEFKETLEPFVEWKKMLGFIVTEEYRDNWSIE